MGFGDEPRALALEQAQRMLRLLPRLRRWATLRVTQSGGSLDLSLRQYACLYAIRQGVTSQTALARQWQVTPAVVTGIVDRLVRRRLVRRTPDLEDRRRQLLSVTKQGEQATVALEQALAQDLAAQLATATHTELRDLERALQLLERVVGALEALVPAPDSAPPED